MKKYGKVIELDNGYGIIRTEDSDANFEEFDVYGGVIHLNDIVSFREENHNGIIMAKSIQVEESDENENS